MMTSIKIMLLFMLLLPFNFILFNNNNNPMNLIMNLIITIMLSTMLIYIYLNKSLFSMMIMISLVGGMMIMLSYFITLINNSKTKMNMLSLSILIINMINLIINMWLLTLNNFFMILNKMNNLIIMNNSTTMIYKIFMDPLNFLTLIFIMFLINMIFFVLKMISKKLLSLRKKKN